MTNENKPDGLSDSTFHKFNSLKMILSTHHLLSIGSFSKAQFAMVEQSLLYLGSLHEQLLNDVARQDDSNLIPDIKEYNANRTIATNKDSAKKESSEEERAAYTSTIENNPDNYFDGRTI